MKKIVVALALAGTALAATTAQANIVAGPSVSGFNTFTDQNTGRNWLRLDSFFNQSPDAMLSAATPAGFTLASQSDVSALLASLPLDGSTEAWDDYAEIMGSAPNRELIWGAFTSAVPGMIDWSWSFRGDWNWNTTVNAMLSSQIANGDSASADLNLWAYSDGAVPEPTTWAMMIGGLGLVGLCMRRSKAEVSFA